MANNSSRKARARAAAVRCCTHDRRQISHFAPYFGCQAARKQKMIETGRISATQAPTAVFDQDMFDQSVHHPSTFFYTHEKIPQGMRNDVR
jgi:hypothetical protein